MTLDRRVAEVDAVDRLAERRRAAGLARIPQEIGRRETVLRLAAQVGFGPALQVKGYPHRVRLPLLTAAAHRR
jgi:hypothetical protein